MTDTCDIYLIKEDKVQKKWKHFPYKHGVHLLTFDYNNIHSYEGSTGLYNRDFNAGGNVCIELSRIAKNWFRGIDVGTVTVKNGIVSVIGRFEKWGSTLFFVPLQEKYND